MEYRVISADDHIDIRWLPKDLWDKRVPEKYRSIVPRVVDTPEGPCWVCGDDRWDTWGATATVTAARGGRRGALERAGMIEPGVLRPTTPELRLADMDRDGIDSSVMYGPVRTLHVPDSDLRRVIYRGYNDWLAEFCANAPERLIGVGLIPTTDPLEAAEELRHLKAAGLRTCMFLAAGVEIPLWNAAWDPLWEAGAETGLPIGFHVGGGMRTWIPSGPQAGHPGNMGMMLSCLGMALDEPLASVIFGGVLERYPTLKIVMAEAGLGWQAYFIQRMDETYGRFLDAEDFWRSQGNLQLTMPPSEYYRRQVWATFQNDPVGIRVIDVIGEDRVMWASDYPHPDSTWPDSRRAIEEQLGGVAPETRRLVVCENARALYGL